MRDFVLSDEVMARKKLSTKNATASKRISILIKNIETGKSKEYKSLTDAANDIKVSKVAVSQALKDNRILKKVYQIIKTK